VVRLISADKAFYSPGELGDLLGLSSDTILNHIKSGKLFAVKLSDRTYRIPQRAAARLVGEAVGPSRVEGGGGGG
jgi:excisionase family DNA binding protein